METGIGKIYGLGVSFFFLLLWIVSNVGFCLGKIIPKSR